MRTSRAWYSLHDCPATTDSNGEFRVTKALGASIVPCARGFTKTFFYASVFVGDGDYYRSMSVDAKYVGPQATMRVARRL